MTSVGPGGFLLVDKPRDVTSFQVVDQVRRRLLQADPSLQVRRIPRPKGGPRPPRFKCGHAGTLDPMATGLLIVLVGKGSRLSPFLMGQDKTYQATVSFGTVTDTLDAMGEVVDSAPVPVDVAGLEEVLAGFRGRIHQVPPLISALKRDGQPLYKRVRAGQEVAEPEARPVDIGRLEVQGVRWGDDVAGKKVFEIDLVVDCSSGTYIRSLARDIARAWGTVGHLQALRRVQVGLFRVDDAVSNVMSATGTELLRAMAPLTDALPQVPVLVLTQDEAAAIRQGGQPLPVWLDRLPAGPVAVGKSEPLFRLVDAAGDLVALGRINPEGAPETALVIPLPETAKDSNSCD